MDFSWSPAKLDEHLVAFITSILSEANIPCVLWGEYVLYIYGVPTAVNSVDFVVPDLAIEAAVNALSNRGLPRCVDVSCATIHAKRVSPPPSVHCHLDFDITVGIYPKSSTLGFLPSLELSEHTPPDIILASDPGLPRHGNRVDRGSGAFLAITGPVRIPSAHRLVESFVRLLATTKVFGWEYIGETWLNYIKKYVDRDGFLDTSLLEPRTKAYYMGLDDLNQDGVGSVRRRLEDVKLAFASEVEEDL